MFKIKKMMSHMGIDSCFIGRHISFPSYKRFYKAEKVIFQMGEYRFIIRKNIKDRTIFAMVFKDDDEEGYNDLIYECEMKLTRRCYNSTCYRMNVQKIEILTKLNTEYIRKTTEFRQARECTLTHYVKPKKLTEAEKLLRGYYRDFLGAILPTQDPFQKAIFSGICRGADKESAK